MKTILATSLLGLALVSGPALAQTAQPADRNAPAATTAQTPANKMMLKGNWRASKLMGLDVYNEANEKLGDVNEFILDKTGKVTAVVIGVGGFLGMGEHDIAVSMDKLKFVEEPVRTSSTAPATTRETTTRNDDGNGQPTRNTTHNGAGAQRQCERLGPRSCRDECNQGAAQGAAPVQVL